MLILFSGIVLTKKIKDYKEMSSKVRTLKVAVNLDLFQDPIDPINNATLSNAFYVNNMYGNLVNVDDNGIYSPDLASAFYWEDNKLVFEFDESNVTSADAEFSIRRAVLNNFNDHANLNYLICKDTKSEKECLENIYSENQRLYIRVQKEKNRELVVPVLAALNYKIVPLRAFDKKDYKESRIVDYNVTSGSYYLKNGDNKNLFANTQTIKKYPQAPTEVSVINANPHDIFDKVATDEVEVISTTVPILEDVAKNLGQKGWTIYTTYPISIVMAVFSDSGIKKTKVDERFYIASRIESELKRTQFFQSEDTIEFLQQFGEGYLTIDQKNHILSQRSLKNKSSSLIRFGVRTPKRWEDFSKIEKNIKIIKLEKSALLLGEKDKPDIFTLSNDVSFDASFTMFSFAVKSGFFSYENKTKEQIIEEFISQKNAQDRIDYLNKVHFDSLKNCRIYPFWASPYTTAARPGIEVNMSKYNSRTLLWKLKIN